MRCFITGPEHYGPNRHEFNFSKKEICQRYDLDACFPTESSLESKTIERSNEIDLHHATLCQLKNCDLLIVNMTPFRGPHMFSACAFELGFAQALSIPVIRYTVDSRSELVKRSSSASSGNPLTIDTPKFPEVVRLTNNQKVTVSERYQHHPDFEFQLSVFNKALIEQLSMVSKKYKFKTPIAV
ncbi:hypothetical protein A3715_20275 [Oleiphilus sp. HI0009]|nr:hypothetical protein A3715_20275 [Oleiphilus sp. HI0009]